MKHTFFRRNGKTVVERFENENVIITRFLSGDVETEFKPTCDKKVKKMYKQLIKELR